MVARWRQTRDELYKSLRIDELKAYLKSMYDDLRQSPLVQKIIQFFTNLGASMPDMSWDRIRVSPLVSQAFLYYSQSACTCSAVDDRVESESASQPSGSRRSPSGRKPSGGLAR